MFNSLIMCNLTARMSNPILFCINYLANIRRTAGVERATGFCRLNPTLDVCLVASISADSVCVCVKVGETV